MNALLFPGQGVQKVGMLNGIFDIEDETKDFIKSAANDLDFDLVELITSGPEEKLNLTEFAQPAILAASIAITKLKKLNNKIDFTAGLSLGEYSALVYADCLKFSDALRLVNYRGKLMQNAVPEGTAGMLVVLNMDLKEVYKMIKKSNHLNRLVTLSPLTDMARKFHLRNGAVELQVNETTQNFEYKVIK